MLINSAVYIWAPVIDPVLSFQALTNKRGCLSSCSNVCVLYTGISCLKWESFFWRNIHRVLPPASPIVQPLRRQAEIIWASECPPPQSRQSARLSVQSSELGGSPTPSPSSKCVNSDEGTDTLVLHVREYYNPSLRSPLPPHCDRWAI
jgi:hypothetical protein